MNQNIIIYYRINVNEIRDNMIIFTKSFNDNGNALGYENNNFNVHSTEFEYQIINKRNIKRIVYSIYILVVKYRLHTIKRKIEFIGETNAYDIEAKITYNIVNGLVVHNCIGKNY